MQFTKDELEELARETCPHCKAGLAVRVRADNGEWVHDQVWTPQGIVRSGHTICWAHGLRKKYTAW